MNAEHYLSLNYRFTLSKDEEGDFIVEVPDLPGCIADGRTAEEALKNVRDAMRAWIESRIAAGLAVPEPRELEEFSGKLVVRMPKGLHRKLSLQADQEGVSLNQYIVSLLSAASTFNAAVNAPVQQVTQLRYVPCMTEPPGTLNVVLHNDNLRYLDRYGYSPIYGGNVVVQQALGGTSARDLCFTTYFGSVESNQLSPGEGNRFKLIPDRKTQFA